VDVRRPDRGLHECYGHLSAVTRADRDWSSARLEEIVALNRGEYDRLIDRTFYRYGAVAALNELAIRRPDGALPGDPAVRDLLVTPVAGDNKYGIGHVLVQ
jgi:hypothetical protein